MNYDQSKEVVPIVPASQTELLSSQWKRSEREREISACRSEDSPSFGPSNISEYAAFHGSFVSTIIYLISKCHNSQVLSRI